jgi:Transposase DDE domain
MRLVVIPKPGRDPQAARRRFARPRKRAMGQPQGSEKANQSSDPRSRRPSYFDHVLAGGGVSIACLGALYRLRWQIELAFKRLKSLLRIDRLPAKGDALASTWLHAHLLFALLIDAAAVEMGDFPP